MADYAALAAIHRAIVADTAKIGRALTHARRAYADAKQAGATTERLAYLDAVREQTEGAYRAGCERAEAANAAATAANPNAEVTR
ncbi:hypothetical protein [Micromonospora sp. WMMD737]|uniref:hypothetical protein n=1 Tax=Micromonospora sp. WMMD737 TaxID=3404113 RepID=UPI003B963D16